MPICYTGAAVVRLLSNLYLCKPTADAVNAWRGLLQREAPPALEDLKAALDKIDTSSSAALDGLLWEYTRLFIGPYRLPCPPWESVYSSPKRLLMQEAYDAVKAVYAAAGVELGDPNVLADHIGAELNFLAILLGRGEEGSANARESFQAARQFCQQHLETWIPRFTADLEASAQSPLYRALGCVTRHAIEVIGQGTSSALTSSLPARM